MSNLNEIKSALSPASHWEQPYCCVMWLHHPPVQPMVVLDWISSQERAIANQRAWFLIGPTGLMALGVQQDRPDVLSGLPGFWLCAAAAGSREPRNAHNLLPPRGFSRFLFGFKGRRPDIRRESRILLARTRAAAADADAADAAAAAAAAAVVSNSSFRLTLSVFVCFKEIVFLVLLLFRAINTAFWFHFSCFLGIWFEQKSGLLLFFGAVFSP